MVKRLFCLTTRCAKQFRAPVVDRRVAPEAQRDTREELRLKGLWPETSRRASGHPACASRIQPSAEGGEG
ncbi:MAG TPA: hypothetical protein DCR97_00635 [Deltaproteobacteria bacterium]|nr:hypothetical protein [Deltaproteobacteria bacterium]